MVQGVERDLEQQVGREVHDNGSESPVVADRCRQGTVVVAYQPHVRRGYPCGHAEQAGVRRRNPRHRYTLRAIARTTRTIRTMTRRVTRSMSDQRVQVEGEATETGDARPGENADELGLCDGDGRQDESDEGESEVELDGIHG